MKITINGEAREFEGSEIPLPELLESLEMSGRPVVVELDREPVLPADHPTAVVKDGSSVEIVLIAAGG